MKGAAALLLCACAHPPTDTATNRSCVAPIGEPAPWVEDVTLRRSLAINLDDDVVVLASLPPEDIGTAWVEGAPVLVVAPAAFRATAVPDERVSLPPRAGAIELRPLYPGQRTEDVEAGGALDLGGAGSAAAVLTTLRFALGDTTDVDGRSLADLSGLPTCGAPALLATSSGLAPALGALEAAPELQDRVAGLAAFESPVLPAFAVFDGGAIWMDPETTVDADGDGVPWDDGRDLDFDPSTCTLDACAVPAAPLSWDEDADLATIWPALVSEAGLRGALYRDRSGDGALSLSETGSPDLDGNGAIDADEDWVSGALIATGSDGESRFFFSPEVLDAARRSGLVLPGDVASVDENLEFWAERAALSRAAVLDIPRAAIAFSAVDHASALPNRDHLTLLARALTGAGVPVLPNASAAVASCLASQRALAGWTGARDRFDPSDLEAQALPESVPAGTVQAIAALGMLWQTYGEFDRCPELDLR